MLWAEGFIAVDWGTTNRRAWRLAADGSVLDEMEDGRGILAVGDGGFEGAVAQVRERLGELPMLLAGMIGSNRGWVEVPYVPCPAGFDELAANLSWVEPGWTAIVAGVAWESGGAADVMRGEEVQLLGAYAEGWIPADGGVCHPGTHNKWVRLEEGRIAAFRTVITGELFNLLKTHSILADLLAGSVAVGDAFDRGVRHGLEESDLTAELFSVRARTLLGKAPREEAASYVSGLLIGSDVRIGLGFVGEGEIVAMGRPDLCRLFCRALEIAGRSSGETEGEAAFLAGIRHLAELVQ
ncbi:MAG TPA: 2-dehydro-3-deoxygalactonokinase [Allosphingosinicella sp.]|jgi:2-dehydro-3-deoxygalactonokinase|nr:2-dehydro-3-deoxygalactonokinase [Allosphingosinicella sp.]